MSSEAMYRPLVKFIAASTLSFFIGSVHGVLQVIRPIRAWLDSIGSPYGGPGHMIDPLAHAHINLIGGVTLLIMGVSYYMLSKILERPIYSAKLMEWSFWMTTTGIYSFYIVLMVFGAWEGMLLLEHSQRTDDIHHTYAVPLIATTASIMGIGLWLHLYNIMMTIRRGK